jgi:hypothetical protein
VSLTPGFADSCSGAVLRAASCVRLSGADAPEAEPVRACANDEPKEDTTAPRRVLLIATTTGYQIRSFGEAAEKLGVRLVFASDRCDRLEDPWWDSAIPVRFHDEDTSVRKMVTAMTDAPPDGILAVGDRPTVLAARVAEAFGLSGNPPAAAAASRNKLASHASLRAAGLPVPEFATVSVDADTRALAGATRYPAVIKPLALSGSRGVMRVNEPAQFVTAFTRLQRLLQSPDVRVERDAAHERILIETFIPGREFAVEGLLTRGAFTPFAIFDKPDPLDGPFFEETIYVTPSRASRDVQNAILEAVIAAAGALGLWHGPVHAECRVNDSGVYVLEVAARPIGGLCSKALRFAPITNHQSPITNELVSLEEVLLRHATGEDVSRLVREPRASGVMMIPIPGRGILRGVEGDDDARAVSGIEEIAITAKKDALLVPLPEGRSYLGFIFARAEEPAAVERALRNAHATLHFVVEKELRVIESRTTEANP